MAGSDDAIEGPNPPQPRSSLLVARRLSAVRLKSVRVTGRRLCRRTRHYTTTRSARNRFLGVAHWFMLS